MKNRASKSDEKLELADCVSCQEHVKLVAFCPECEGMVCSECVDAHKKMKQLRDDHHVTMFSDLKQEHVNSYITNQFHCQEKFHEKHKLEYYCETCLKCICPKCSNTAHSSHDKTSIEEKAEEIKRVINQDLELINRLKEKFNKELELSQLNMIRIEKEINSAKKEVCDHVQAQMKVLQDHENTTMKTLDEMYLDQKAANDEEQREINTSIQHLDTFTNEVKDQKLVHFILQNQLPQRCEELLQMQSVLKSKPNKRNASVHYVTHTPVTQLLQKFGEIEENVTDPSRCSIKSLDGTIQCGVLGKFQIVTRNAKGQVCYTNEGSIDVKIKDEEGCEIENQVTKNPKKGRYTVTFKAKKPSTYHIQVNIGGKQITNSPASIKAFKEKINIRPVKIFALSYDYFPQLFYVSNSGEMAIVREIIDRYREGVYVPQDAYRVALYSGDGSFVREFGRHGSEDGQLDYPRGVVIYKDKIFVSDSPCDTGYDLHGRIQLFDINGTYLRTIFKQKGSSIEGMCDANQNIAVCWYNRDNQKDSGVKLFNKESGHLVQEFSTYHGEDKTLSDIAFGNSKYFVLFAWDCHIHVYDDNGVFLYKFEVKGVGEYDHIMHGLAVYGGDKILVCDITNNRVQVFTEEGQFLTSFGCHGSGLGQMYRPIDVAVTQDGKILVLDMEGKRVQVWQ